MRLGQSLEDRIELLRLFAKHGGLMAHGGGDQLVSLRTTARGAPRLHLRDTGPDGILFVEVLVEEDYRALRRLNLRPRVIFDIGANIGLGSFFMKTLYPEARIIGFEPSEAEGSVLRRNYAGWQDCETMAVAVGDRDGVNVTFAVHPAKTGGQHLAAVEDAGDWQHVSVPMRRIDALIDEGRLPLPDLVKMDIEGAEVVALQGFGRHLGTPAAYILETHSPALHEECLHLLGAAGYAVADDVSRGGEARILCMVKAAAPGDIP